MPLGEAFSKVIYANESAYFSTLTPSLIVKLAFGTVTQADCLGYIRHSGYM